MVSKTVSLIKAESFIGVEKRESEERLVKRYKGSVMQDALIQEI